MQQSTEADDNCPEWQEKGYTLLIVNVLEPGQAKNFLQG